jgi:hypothetical protein
LKPGDNDDAAFLTAKDVLGYVEEPVKKKSFPPVVDKLSFEVSAATPFIDKDKLPVLTL